MSFHLFVSWVIKTSDDDKHSKILPHSWKSSLPFFITYGSKINIFVSYLRLGNKKELHSLYFTLSYTSNEHLD